MVMKRTDFIKRIEQIIEVNAGSLVAETRFDEIPEWDSLAVLDLIALMDAEFGVDVTFEMLEKCDTRSDVITIAGKGIVE